MAETGKVDPWHGRAHPWHDRYVAQVRRVVFEARRNMAPTVLLSVVEVEALLVYVPEDVGQTTMRAEDGA